MVINCVKISEIKSKCWVLKLVEDNIQISSVPYDTSYAH